MQVKTTQELLEDLARRSGSPNLVARSDVQSIHQQQQQQAVTVPVSSEARQWPDAKQELLDKFFRSHSTDRRSEGTTTSAVVSKPTSVANDPVAEIYARLPPLDPSVVAPIWREEEVQPEDQDELEAVVIPRRPVRHNLNNNWECHETKKKHCFFYYNR